MLYLKIIPLTERGKEIILKTRRENENDKHYDTYKKMFVENWDRDILYIYVIDEKLKTLYTLGHYQNFQRIIDDAIMQNGAVKGIDFITAIEEN